MVILCLEGTLVLLGIILLGRGTSHVFGRRIQGRRLWVMGLALIAQAPLGLLLAPLWLGESGPGSINGADPIDARNRIAALCFEWAMVSGAIAINVYGILSAPKQQQ